MPEAYRLIWSLRPSGVISFNLDSLAQEAMEGASDQVATAREVAKYRRFLLSQRPFLFQPHGCVGNYTTWVLGGVARNALLRSPDYRGFISSVFSSRRLVILGFEPRDLAFESLLLTDFREAADSSLCHFWITPRLEADARDYARLYNLAPIEYDPADESHPEVAATLRHLKGFAPRSLSAPQAYEGATIPVGELPPDESLRGEMVDSIRRKLNAALASVIQEARTSGHDLTEAIAAFFDQYSGSVRMAWHVKPDSPYSVLWGYRAREPLGEGAFSSVWKVTDVADACTYALKLMREEITRDLRMFEAFRRGVQAMRILKARNVGGMVGLHAAFDIPACVVMDFVAGETLYDALKSGLIDSFALALRVVHRVGTIVHAGHQLPERVLHRDLKPTNVMLRRTDELDVRSGVVVLDFDLSWYEGALGHSMLPGLRLANYLAPEQVRPGPRKYSSRHTAVDVFGCGMLLYFVATGVDPEMNVQQRRDFQEATTQLINNRWRPVFRSVAETVTRLIAECTVDDQPERIALPNFLDALKQVADCLGSERIPVPSDLAILELVGSLPDELWERVPTAGEAGSVRARSRVSGAQVEASFELDRTNPGLKVTISYAEGGETPRSRVGKYLNDKSNQAASELRRGGAFSDVQATVALGTASVSAVARGPDWDKARVNQLQRALGAAAAKLSLK
jgi:serine/threonine protein kinase